MERNRNTAERVRPILEAMEKSIDRVRRQRLHGHDQPEPGPGSPGATDSKPGAPSPPAVNGSPSTPPPPPQRESGQGPNDPSTSSSSSDDASRPLKAQPKRPNPFLRGTDDSPFRSQAS